MHHYASVDPYVIRERNEELLHEVSILRLERGLRKDRRPIISRVVAFASKSTVPVLRRVGLQGASSAGAKPATTGRSTRSTRGERA